MNEVVVTNSQAVSRYFDWKVWGKRQRETTSIRIAILWVKIWTPYLPKQKQVSQHLDGNVASLVIVPGCTVRQSSCNANFAASSFKILNPQTAAHSILCGYVGSIGTSSKVVCGQDINRKGFKIMWTIEGDEKLGWFVKGWSRRLEGRKSVKAGSRG